jgi:hypothetical protein
MHCDNDKYDDNLLTNMKTVVPDSLSPGLSDNQLECLSVLGDGDWHDYQEISKKLKNYILSNLSGRVIRPLRERGIIEEEARPVKEGSKKHKKFFRIRKDLDEQSLHEIHLLIEYSANALVMKYRGKNRERSQFFLKIRDESIKKLSELEKTEEEHRQRLKDEYWKKKESSIPYSESWPKLIAAAKLIEDRFEKALKPLDGVPFRPYQLTFERIIKELPSKAFLAAIDANPELYKKVEKESKRHEWKEYYGIDADEWDLQAKYPESRR